jgi:hypothetical protein
LRQGRSRPAKRQEARQPRPAGPEQAPHPAAVRIVTWRRWRAASSRSCRGSRPGRYWPTCPS